jgi:hypothetical protein
MIFTSANGAVSEIKAALQRGFNLPGSEGSFAYPQETIDVAKALFASLSQAQGALPNSNATYSADIATYNYQVAARNSAIADYGATFAQVNSIVLSTGGQFTNFSLSSSANTAIGAALTTAIAALTSAQNIYGLAMATANQTALAAKFAAIPALPTPPATPSPAPAEAFALLLEQAAAFASLVGLN